MLDAVFEGGDAVCFDAEDLEKLEQKTLRLRLLVVGQAPSLRELRCVASYIVPALHDSGNLWKTRVAGLRAVGQGFADNCKESAVASP